MDFLLLLSDPVIITYYIVLVITIGKRYQIFWRKMRILFGNSTKFQWKDKFQVSEIIEKDEVYLDEIYGIGGCSGIDGDPFSR